MTEGAAAKVLVYRTVHCPFCVASEQLLASKGVELEQIYLDDHRDRRGFVDQILPGHSTVPLVLIDGKPVGGYQELMALDARGELDRMLFP